MPPNVLGRIALTVALLALIGFRVPFGGTIVSIAAIALAILALRDKSKGVGAAVAAITIGVFLGLASFSSSWNANNAGPAALDAASEDAESADAEGADPVGPREQRLFVEINDEAAGAAEGVENTLKLDRIMQERDAQLCAALPHQKLAGWVGTIEDIGADDLNYQGHLTIRISPAITIGTWNNAFSDLGDDTLISYKSELFKRLADFDVGDQVRFDAKMLRGRGDECVRGRNSSSSSYGTEPKYLAKITSLSWVE